jgi:hypothetical protein
LLFRPLAWMPAPPRGRCHLRFLRHFRWLTQSRAKRQGSDMRQTTAAAVHSTSTSLRTRGSAVRYPC